MNQPGREAPPYRHVAPMYDVLASAYSLGAIDRAKRHHHSLINQGQRVLFAGAGRGREIVGAIERGAEVTCIEPCPAMASRLHRRLSVVGDNFIIVPRPIQSISVAASYDLVIAHFFLNVFDIDTMPEVLDHLAGFVRPGGRFVIADFMPNLDGDVRLARCARSVYYRPLNLAGKALRICALHPIYDYAPMLAERGFLIEPWHTFRVLPGLPAMYGVVTARRPKAHSTAPPAEE